MFSLIFFSFFFLFIALSMTCRAAPPFIAASSTYCFWFSLSCFLFFSSFDYYDFPYASFRFVYHILWVFYCLMRRSHGRKFLNKRMSPTIRLSTQFKRIQDKQMNNQRKKNRTSITAEFPPNYSRVQRAKSYQLSIDPTERDLIYLINSPHALSHCKTKTPEVYLTQRMVSMPLTD